MRLQYLNLDFLNSIGLKTKGIWDEISTAYLTNPSVQMASPSASSCNCTWNTRNMQHACNPQCVSLNVPLGLQTMDFSSKQARSTLCGRVLPGTFTTGGKLSTAALIILIMMMPMMLVSQLWYQSSTSSPVCSLLQWRELRTGQSQPRLSAVLRTGQSEREDAGRFCAPGMRWCDRGSDATFLNEQMWLSFDQLVYSFTDYYGFKKWLWNKHAMYWFDKKRLGSETRSETFRQIY